MAIFPFKRKSVETHNMRDKIVIIETLIFVLPLLAILYIIYRGNYYFDLLQVIMFMVIAFFVLVGMIILRQILTRISIIATSLKKAESGNAIPIDVQKDVVEFHEMSVSLNSILQKLEQVTAALTQKSLELSVIKNLTDIIKGNLSTDDQLNILLEKCMAVTGAQIGSVLIVEPEMRQQYMAAKSTPISASDLYRFRVCATIGHGEELKKGTLINIEKSVVKAALLEKEPLLIQDISKDPRTSKTNDPKYGPPSFLSMPIIIGDAVSAILNLSYKGKGQLFDDNDEQVISIILRDIGFALENTMLQSRINEQLEKIKGHRIELEREIEERTRTEMMSKYSNIAELKKVEETLAESEKKYRFITEKMTDIVWIQDVNLRTVYVSPSIEAVLGFTPEERVSQDGLEQLTPESMSVALDVMAKELALEQQGQADPERKIVIELEYYHKDGSTRWMENIISGIRDDKGVLTGLHGVSRDITKRRQAQEALRKAEENFRRSLDESPMGVRIVTLEGNTLYANRAILDIYGYDSIEELMATPVKNRYTPQSYAEFQTRLEKRKKGDHEPSEYEISIVGKNGEIRHLLAFRKEVIWDGERQFQLLYHDITNHKRAEEALEREHTLLRNLIDNVPDRIYAKDAEGRFIICNEAMIRRMGMTSMSQLEGKTDFDFLPLEMAQRFYDDEKEIMRSGTPMINHEEPLAIEGGKITRWNLATKVPLLDKQGNRIGIVGVGREITDLRRAMEELQGAREQLLQSEKLASLGRLSVGVAHEILNPVNIISMELQMLQAMESLPPEVLEELKICMAQTKRIVSITQNLKQLSRLPIKKTVMADMNDTIAHILNLHAGQLKIEGIETEVQYQPDLPAIAIDKEKIEHVILNLISNAMDAMEGKEKKVLSIRTEMDKMPGDREQLKITIADTGTGIHSEHMSKIFDPFFTTKEPGKGTGLGLSISYSIVHDHEGMIWAANNEWGGASFYVRLPIKMDV